MTLHAPDEELVRVLSNPDNLIVSESLLERLPSKNKDQVPKCKISIDGVEYSGNCSFLNVQKEKLQVSIELELETDSFAFIKKGFPSNVFDSEVLIILLGDEEKNITGSISEISCEPTPNSSCIMSLVVYNYQLEDSHGS